MRLAAALVLVAVVAALAGYLAGRHHRGDGGDRQLAAADAQEVIGAYNVNGSGREYHLVWLGKVAPHIWRFQAKENGKINYACVQLNLSQYWHGQGTSFHGVGVGVDGRLCPRSH
jgi:hypothetical protein